jgi:hypothetical protein
MRSDLARLSATRCVRCSPQAVVEGSLQAAGFKVHRLQAAGFRVHCRRRALRFSGCRRRALCGSARSRCRRCSSSRRSRGRTASSRAESGEYSTVAHGAAQRVLCGMSLGARDRREHPLHCTALHCVYLLARHLPTLPVRLQVQARNRDDVEAPHSARVRDEPRRSRRRCRRRR